MRGIIIPAGLSLFLTLFIQSTTAQFITWHQHIAPIIHQQCTPCHRQGEAGPFTLISYEDVAKRAEFVKKVTQNRYMPPWKPDPHYTTFQNERRLTDEQIKMIADWADHNMPKGTPVPEEKPLVLIPGTQYNRKPDMVLRMKQPFHIKGDNLERFVVYKIPFEMTDSLNVEAVEFISSNRKAIHHVNYEIDAVPDIDIYNTIDHINLTEEPNSLYEQFVPFRKHMIYYGGWIPGASLDSYPAGIGWVMPKRGVMLLTVHFAATGKEEDNISGIQLFFTKTAVKRSIIPISFGSGGIGEKEIDPFFYIPANAVKSFKVKTTIPEDRSVLYVWPHMHYLGKIFKAYGVTPQGDTIRLVSINDWEFKWQEIYWFPKYVKMPRGTVLTIEGTYDNTINNPANPSNPPKLVYSNGEMKSIDEMMTLVMLYLPYKEGDENRAIKK